MKKTWLNPEIENLEITKTAGGPIFNTTQDGEIWWNKEENRYEIPVGTTDDKSN